MSAKTPHVLVIGAGTGGLCLAHGLRRAGLDVSVHERHTTRADGLLGYRVGISPTGSRALRECLPPELFDTFVVTCARAPATSTSSPSGCAGPRRSSCARTPTRSTPNAPSHG